MDKGHSTVMKMDTGCSEDMKMCSGLCKDVRMDNGYGEDMRMDPGDAEDMGMYNAHCKDMMMDTGHDEDMEIDSRHGGGPWSTFHLGLFFLPPGYEPSELNLLFPASIRAQSNRGRLGRNTIHKKRLSSGMIQAPDWTESECCLLKMSKGILYPSVVFDTVED
ncbi:hypothetical protein STEG23_033386 [Scotinomys teguina]